jgi:hypothetical protein
MLVQPLDDGAIERLELSISAHPAAVMLQKARALVETRSPIFCAPLGAATCRARFSVFSWFSRFSSAHPRQQTSDNGAVGDDGDDSISLRLILQVGGWGA